MRPKRSLGQNFLRDDTVVSRIVATLDISRDDSVVEIGPGRGVLTERLVETGASIVAVEIDQELIPVLQRRFADKANFQVIEADFLTVDVDAVLGSIPSQRVKIVGNLPYYISTPIIQRLITLGPRFDRAVLMLQREVVERLTAEPGNSERGFITVLTENSFKTKHLFDVPPEAFFPAPKVWSSVMRIIPTGVDPGDHAKLAPLLSAAFAQKRKTILNNLRTYISNAGELLHLSGIEPSRRAETLTLEEWKRLCSAIDQDR